MILPGDPVLCVLPPAVSKGDLPKDRPKIGQRYTLLGSYAAEYGIGCTLEGLDPFPYDGYVLYAQPDNKLFVAHGWYFVKLTTFGQSVG